MTRSRWAAIGAAIAVSFGAGGIGIGQATNPSGASTFVAITPCRIMDTRPTFQVGPRSAPLGPNDTYTLPGAGSVGQCSIPSEATGLVLNVTAVEATAPTFLTVYPAGEALPGASHLNPVPDQPPTPNAVTTNLGSGQQFSIFNLAGTVHVIADAVGYYTDHDHDDRYYTKSETDADFVTQADADAYLTQAEADAAYVAAPVDHVTIPIASFSRERSQASDGVGWEFTQGFWIHQEAVSATTACLIAPVDAPEGAVVTSVDVSYLEEGGPTELTVSVTGVLGTPGTFANEFDVIKYHYYFDADIAATAPSSISRVNLPHDNGPLLMAGTDQSPILGELASPSMTLCTDTDLSLLNVRVNFDMP